VPDSGDVVVIDVGGTSFRVGVLSNGTHLHSVTSRPSISRSASTPDVLELQRQLVSLIIETVDGFRRTTRFDRVGISIGAAMNEKTGIVLASAPLWGDGRWPLPLREILATHRPGISWHVLNDVSAQAISLAGMLPANTRRAAAVTVSTGIAYRTIDLGDASFPYDAVHGLQGEIGHLPASCTWRGRPLTAVCDCGIENHVAAFASGRGMERLLSAHLHPSLSGLTGLSGLVAACRHGDPVALEFLDACTEPLARILLTQAALDPTIEFTVLMGGIAHAFGELYRASVLKHLSEWQLYLISDVDPAYFERRLLLSTAVGVEALRGAGRHALNYRKEAVPALRVPAERGEDVA